MNYLETHCDSRISAQDLYDAMQAQNYKVNLATIYRQLERLSDDGTVLKVKSSADDRHYYQYTGEHDNCSSHLHMQCSCCGKIIHLECHFMDSISEHLLSHHGFQLNCADSLLMGLCRECQESAHA